MGKLKLNITAGVLCIAGGLFFITGFSQQPAGPNGSADPAAVTVMPVQLGRDTYGIVMVDRQMQTLWVYEFNTRGQTFDQLRLIAARSYAYDRQLTEWNTAAPTPTQVKNIVESMQSRQQPKPPTQDEREQKEIEELRQLIEQE